MCICILSDRRHIRVRANSTSSPLTSMAILCISRFRVNTTWNPLFFRTTIPSTPARAPRVMRTRCPTVSSGCGAALVGSRPARSASTSKSGSGAGCYRRSDHRNHTGHFKYSNPIVQIDANKYVSRKQRQIDHHPGPVFPCVLRAVDRQKMLDLPLFQVSSHALLVPTRRVYRKPVSCQVLRLGLRRRAAIFAQSFAVLTWWGVFHNCAPGRILVFLKAGKLSTGSRNRIHPCRDTATFRSF